MPTHPHWSLVYQDVNDWVLPHVLEDRAQSHRDKPYLIEAEGKRRVFSFKQTYEIAQAIGHGLSRRGLGHGDRLAVMLHNCPEYLFAWYGASSAGIIEVPINTDYSGTFLEHAISLTGPQGVVTSTNLVDRFIASREKVAGDLTFFIVDDGGDVTRSVKEIEAAGWSAEPFDGLLATPPDVMAIHRDLHRQDLGAIVFTSGTTGPSKGVMMSHSQLHLFAEETVHVVRLTERDTYQLALPLFHGNAQFMTAYPALIVGATIVMFERFSPSRFVERIQAYSITVANFVGVMMDWVWRQPRTPNDAQTTLRCVLSAPTPASIAAAFQERFRLEAITEVFGQTEICLPFLSPYGVPRPPGAAGLLVDQFFEVMITDPETDDPVAPGQIGELVVRPKLPWTINSGYWGMPQATADARRNLWFHTGDALKQDADGWFYFVDRIKDALRRRGENISSYEVEQAIQMHEAVAECAVVAIPSEYEGGEDEIKAVLVLKAPVAFEELITWATDRMPYFIVPRYWETVEELPKTPSAKVQKGILRKAGLTPATFDREAAGITIGRRQPTSRRE